MRNFTTYLHARYGLHARPCAILATLHKHYFRGSDIVLIDLASGREASLGSIRELMMVASPYGRHLEFLTMLDREQFQDFRDIVLSLSYQAKVNGNFVKTEDTYDNCFWLLTQCVGDHRLLLSSLHQAASAPDRGYLFGEAPPAEAPSAEAAPASNAFAFNRSTLEVLHRIDPLCTRTR
jgi:phosphotransferase system HPr-like phosphotransfer protein